MTDFSTQNSGAAVPMAAITEHHTTADAKKVVALFDTGSAYAEASTAFPFPVTPISTKNVRDVSSLDVTLNSGTTTATLSDLDVEDYTHFAIGFECDASAATGDHSFDIIVSFSRDGTVYYKYQNDFWGFLRYEDTAFATADTILLEGRIPSGMLFMQIDIVGNSLSGSESFIFDDWFMGLDSSK